MYRSVVLLVLLHMCHQKNNFYYSSYAKSKQSHNWCV